MNHTPVEDHGGILVKREDLFRPPPYPPLSKLRGVESVVDRLIATEGINTFGALDTSVSMSGQGLAAVCRDRGCKAIVCFPWYVGQTELQPQQRICQELGAELVKIKAGRVGVMYSQAKKEVWQRSGVMFPMGMTLAETAQEVRAETSFTLKTHPARSIVVSVGTGTILSGIVLGIKDAVEAGSGPFDLWAISCGMHPNRQRRRMQTLGVCPIFPGLHFHHLLDHYSYYDQATVACPFNAHPNYDLKAWDWLQRNKDRLPGPILFWNIGGVNHA